MSKHVGVFTRALMVLMLFTRTARAFLDPPYVTPSSPLENEELSVNIEGGICDGIISRYGYPQITRQGNNIRLLFIGVHFETGSDWCIYPIFTARQTLGSFLPGDYSLTAELQYRHPVFGTTLLPIGTVEFTVAANAAVRPTPVPGLGFPTIVLLIGLTGVAGVIAKRGYSVNSSLPLCR